MKRLKYICFVMAACAVILGGCADKKVEAVPELLAPEGVRIDTERARRGRIEDSYRYNAYVMARSEGVFFKDIPLRLKSVNVTAGQYVKQGDVLAELQTADIEESIEKQEEAIAFQKRTYAHDNEAAAYDLQIAYAELETSNDSEAKAFAIKRMELALEQQKERQDSELKLQYKKLEALKAQLTDAVITAPFDGKINYIEPVSIGSRVVAFKPIVYVAKPDELFVQYTGIDYFSYAEGDLLVGKIGTVEYELEYTPMPITELLQYVFSGRTAPIRFVFKKPDENVQEGQYVSIIQIKNMAEDAVIVPATAVFMNQTDGHYVYAIEDGKKVVVPVKLGIRNDASMQITEGVDEGDEIFVKQ